MEILLAPLHGHTDYVFRNALFKHYAGIDACYSPFITTVKGATVPESHIRDVLHRHNRVKCLIPQIIGKNPDEFIVLANRLSSLGFKTVNWNLGCPYPMVVNKKRGAGLLPHPELISGFLKTVIPNVTCAVEVKIRLGKDDPAEALDVIDVLDSFELGRVIIHPRTARQMYNGTVDLDSFEKCLKICRHPVAYNGDIVDTASFWAIGQRFKNVDTFMIGRGLLMDPSLAEKIKAIAPPSGKGRAERLYRFHEDIVRGYREMGNAGQGLLGRLKQFWCFFSYSFPKPEERLRKVQRAKSMEAYREMVEEGFGMM
jgi:tRNA-dihydrouridine synthase B